MGRLPLAALLVVAACQRTPARIYTDADIAKLEERVLAKVAETDASCSKPELLEFVSSLDRECATKCQKVENDLKQRHVNVESLEVGKLDEECGEKVLTAWGRAASASPSCSPFQVGVHADPADLYDAKSLRGSIEMPRALMMFHTTHILTRHALREVDPYVGLTELFVGLPVTQDLGRGRVSLMASSFAQGSEDEILRTIDTLLTRSALSKDQLDDVAATLEAAIANEPDISELLQGEALSIALHMGLAGLKPADWQPPGGRGEFTLSKDWPPRDTNHDRRDDFAQSMASELRYSEIYAAACPPSGSLMRCYANLSRNRQPMPEFDLETDRHAARVAMFPDDETRHDSQKQLLAKMTQFQFLDSFVQSQARTLARLSAVRLHVQVLRDGACPSKTQLDKAPYLALRTPAVLGDSLPVTVKSDSIVVAVPDWARQGTFEKYYEPITIKCP